MRNMATITGLTRTCRSADEDNMEASEEEELEWLPLAVQDIEQDDEETDWLPKKRSLSGLTLGAGADADTS